MAYQFQTFNDFTFTFQKHLNRVKTGKYKNAPSAAAFGRVNRLIQAVTDNTIRRNVLMRRVNRYLKEVALFNLFENEELAADIYLDALHGNLASICWLLGIADNEEEPKAALQFVLDETGTRGAQL